MPHANTHAATPASHLSPVTGFGSNPGALTGWSFVPGRLAPGAALVVVLHGCTQTAAGYDRGSGWSTLAEREGFALLYPEQARANNPNLCFNWFQAEDIRRDAGEPLSIRQMIAAMIDAHGIDPARVFITGLSAGGAMTSVMLATYPEVFAAGAIIAGLPFGSAGSVPQAFDRMRGHGGPDDEALADLVRAAARDHTGNWPAVSVWHGGADSTVAAVNMDRSVAQWLGVHAIDAKPESMRPAPGHAVRLWRNADGRVVVEDHAVKNMGHGTPLDPSGPDGIGAAAPYMLDVGIDSTSAIAVNWGIASVAKQKPQANRPSPAPAKPQPRRAAPRQAVPKAQATGVQKVIEDALRSAGLMK